ncbi:MAG: AAA family ATPase [Candidatus Dadabacteria bacterium]|nr:AAA family ATPase [Candidatus Dadabacteria bacterium]
MPILGPVEHREPLYQSEAARRALFNYTAARNFRNIWHHYPEHFDRFRTVLRETWPGMDIEKPEVDMTHDKPLLHMFCKEDRVARELFWAGFGFQVWCQMLTHLIQSADSSLFLIDEPDIYLHSELQRQLLALLRGLGPDILIATHSTEIIAEAETTDILLIDKRARYARRLKNPSQLSEVFAALGSTANPILTQLAKTQKAVFVEGKDFRVISAFERKLKKESVSAQHGFAVVPVGGFNPDRIRSLKKGMEATLERDVLAVAILDRDYRSDAECESITGKCEGFCEYVKILDRKEIENFVLVPSAIDRAAGRKVSDQAQRSGNEIEYLCEASVILDKFAAGKKNWVEAQFLSNRREFLRSEGTKADDTQIHAESLEKFEQLWSDPVKRYELIPGKEAISAINVHLQETHGVNITPVAIIAAMRDDEIPSEVRELVDKLASFSCL